MQNEEVVIIHPCENCSEIQAQINARLKLYGYDEIAAYSNYKEEIMHEICSSCGCDKFGVSKIWYANSNGCEDYPEPSNRKKPQCSRKKRLSKRERNIKHKNHLKYLSDNLRNYPSPAIALDKNSEWIKDKEWVNLFPDDEIKDVAYYKRYYRGKRSKYLKKLSHKKVRRYTCDLPRKGNQSNKLFDFWWELD